MEILLEVFFLGTSPRVPLGIPLGVILIISLGTLKYIPLGFLAEISTRVHELPRKIPGVFSVELQNFSEYHLEFLREFLKELPREFLQEFLRESF